MKRLFNKRFILGVTGSIAAYKAGEIVRELKRAGADVQVIMTDGAREFITSMTFQALSGHPVHTQLMSEQAEAGMGHIALARWADAILIAPASANTLASLAHGRADNLLTAVCLASAAPLAVAPAMNQQMWKNRITAENINRLFEHGVRVFGPDQGDQACGDNGPGRMMEPLEIVKHCADLFQDAALSGNTVMITAGPTQEAIDPVRFLTNRSSGKMGYALAQAAVEQGARCILVSGPVSLETPDRVERIDVVSANEMLDAVLERISECDIFIGCAAVADYRPNQTAEHKIKKGENNLVLELVPNPDILARVGSDTDVFAVGFAAETQRLEAHARAKLDAKNLDMIAANWVNREDTGFEAEENALSVYWHGGIQELEQAPKQKIAKQLIEIIADRYKSKDN